MKKKSKYIENDIWTKYAQDKLGVLNEAPTLNTLHQLVEKGHFVKKQSIKRGLSHQKIKFIVLDKSMFDYYMFYLMPLDKEQTFGFYWLWGYPVIYE